VKVSDNTLPTPATDDEQITVTVAAAAVLAIEPGTLPQANLTSIKDVTVYPNPVRGRFTVTMNGINGPASAILKTVNGMVVKRWSLISNEGKFAFDATGLKPGQYILQVYSDNRNWVFKIVKL
jgi:hypothetical protein